MTSTNDLLAEVDARATARNGEVIAFLLNRICNYQKARLRLERLLGSVDVSSLDHDDYWTWRQWKSLRKKVNFKTPCRVCPACRNRV